jgi:hypothetical protein
MNRNLLIALAAMLVAILAILYFVFGLGTHTPPKPVVVNDGGCAISPPQSTKVNREVALKVAADLTKLTKMPASGETQVTAKNTAEEIFQKIPDTDVACHMLLETIACLSREPRNQATVQSLVAYMKDGDKCGSQPPPKNAYELRIQGQSTTTTGDHFALDLGYVETGKELTIPITLIARLPANPPLKITLAEQPVRGTWQSGTDTVVASEQTPGVLVLTIPAQNADEELRREIRISPSTNKPFPTMTLAVHLHALPATRAIENTSGDKPSGNRKDFSGVYTVCADAPSPGDYTYVSTSTKYWLTGDRECNAWSTCKGTIDPNGKQVCMQFTLQGHDECPGFNGCAAMRNSEGHIQATFRLQPSRPSLHAAGA